MHDSKNLSWFLLLPAAGLGFWMALSFPDATDRVYATTIYPAIVWAFGALNRSASSVAEPLAVILAVVGLAVLYRHATRLPRRPWRVLGIIWGAAGVAAWSFLLLWGLNYARPSLGTRMHLEASQARSIDARTVLDAGRRAARRTTELYDALDTRERPTSLPWGFDELNRLLDDAYAELNLPGDAVRATPTPAKPLRSSLLFSYLGVSGIFVPFTGEPSVNALQPEAALPIVVAHEKAHQRGITHEGEANFAAFLACARETNPLYLRYAAYLFATRYLLSEAAVYLPPEALQPAWEELGDGPRADIRAIREFWQRYEGPATRVASSVNDSYLRAMHVPGGVESYGTVVRLLMALDERGRFLPAGN